MNNSNACPENADAGCSPAKPEACRYPIRQIYFYLTEGCNLRCRHCWIEPRFQNSGERFPSLDPELFESILDQAAALGMQGVKLTGGEPLLHPEILRLLDAVEKRNLSLTLETNGLLCLPEIAVRIASFKKRFVSVSLDGADPETHEWVRGVKGSFAAACEGIRNLANAGLRPQIIFTVMKRNQGQLEGVVRLAEKLGAGSVKFNLVQPTARGEQLHDQAETLPVKELIRLGQWAENELAFTTSLRLYYSHPPAFRALGRLFGDKGSCGVCGILGILGVLANGTYALCGIGTTVPELVFGDARKDRLEGVWREHPVLNEIRLGMPGRLEGICADCTMKGRCLGSCLAQNYYRDRNLWAGFWFCEDAAENGLFPDSRRISKLIEIRDSKRPVKNR